MQIFTEHALPVPSGIGVEVLRACLLGVEADDAVDDLFAGAYAVESAGVAAEPKHLPGPGNQSSSQAAMRIVRRSVRPCPRSESMSVWSAKSMSLPDNNAWAACRASG